MKAYFCHSLASLTRQVKSPRTQLLDVVFHPILWPKGRQKRPEIAPGYLFRPGNSVVVMEERRGGHDFSFLHKRKRKQSLRMLFIYLGRRVSSPRMKTFSRVQNEMPSHHWCLR